MEDGQKSQEARHRAQSRVAQLIRTARRRAGLTQSGLAHRLTQMGEPTSRSQISMYETSQMPTAAKLIAIIEAATAVPARTDMDRDLDQLAERFGQLARPNPRPPPTPRRDG